MYALTILTAFVLDLALGDPSSWPHPVRLFGRLISLATPRLLERHAPGRGRRLAGAALALGLVASVWLAVTLLLGLLAALSTVLAFLAAAYLAYTALALKDLLEHVQHAHEALTAHDLDLARKLTARVVGRETDRLDEAGLSRALIETLAENLSDGFIAPLFYLLLGGPALALAFKAVSTLDSMIGHKNEQYADLGLAAARLDDAANWIPARLTALLIALAAWLLALRPGGALGAWRADAKKHPSPNAGHPEAAMAGALGVRLGGPAFYQGRRMEKAWLNAGGAQAGANHVFQAARLAFLAGLLGFSVALILAVILGAMV